MQEFSADMNTVPFMRSVPERDSSVVKGGTYNPGMVQFGGAGR